MKFLELAFSLLYLGEVTLKLAVKSCEEYFADRANIFDFFTTWLLLGTSVLQEEGGAELSRYANVLRLLRLLRVVKQLKSLPAVQFMVSTMVKLISASTDILS